MWGAKFVNEIIPLPVSRWVRLAQATLFSSDENFVIGVAVEKGFVDPNWFSVVTLGIGNELVKQAQRFGFSLEAMEALVDGTSGFVEIQNETFLNGVVPTETIH